MKKLLLLATTLSVTGLVAQQVPTDSLAQKKGKAMDTENNRNVMLNASSNSGPREVNIGLPSSVGGITVLENDLPVVYYFWPELPTRTWRPSTSLNMRGLISIGESALTIGDFGFAVNTYTKTGGDETKVGSMKVNHHGYYNTDVNVSGAFGKGWYYSIGGLISGDPGEAKHKAINLVDDTRIYRLVLTKKLSNGEISLGYKYSKSNMAGGYAPFVYHIDGSVSKYKGFEIGTDSYILESGRFLERNSLTGQEYYHKLTTDNWSYSNNIDLFGHNFIGNGWTFKHSSRFKKSRPSAYAGIMAGIQPVGTREFVYENGTPYTGDIVQQMMAMNSPKMQTTTFMSRLWVEKKNSNHQWRYGIHGLYYEVDNYRQDRTFLFHEVKKNPLLLIEKGKPAYFNINAGGEYHDGYETKMNFYANDVWQVSPNFELSYGANFQYQKLKGEFSMAPRSGAILLKDTQYIETFDHDWFHINGDLKAVYKITPSFGLIGNFTYQEKHGQLENYSGAYRPNFDKTKTPFGAFGVYYNSKLISLVSQVSTLSRNNYQTRLNITDRTKTANNTLVEAVHYDIQTTGWTTDVLLNPGKGFSLHYLLTLQNPVYKNYSFKNPHNNAETISYNDNIVNGISKVLMEIDPSYSYKNFRIGANFRYFSKQYVSLTNQFYFKPRWESFAHASYQLKKNIGFTAGVVNIFNQKGASGSIYASELPYANRNDAEGTIVTGSYIRPLTFEFQVNFNF